jgi:hypothetical protein
MGANSPPIAREIPKFVAVQKTVMRGSEFICNAVSHTMALRISNALNVYRPGSKGY